MNGEYAKEVDLMFRLRFERGLMPYPGNYTNHSLQAMAKEYQRLSLLLDKLDTELTHMYQDIKV